MKNKVTKADDKYRYSVKRLPDDIDPTASYHKVGLQNLEVKTLSKWRFVPVVLLFGADCTTTSTFTFMSYIANFLWK